MDKQFNINYRNAKNSMTNLILNKIIGIVDTEKFDGRLVTAAALYFKL